MIHLYVIINMVSRISWLRWLIKLSVGEPQKKKKKDWRYGLLEFKNPNSGLGLSKWHLKDLTQGQRLPSSPSSPYLVPVLASIIQVLILDAFCMEYLSKLVLEKNSLSKTWKLLVPVIGNMRVSWLVMVVRSILNTSHSWLSESWII